MMSVISEAVDAICSLSLIAGELRSKRVEPRSDGAVHQVITELDLRAADERLIDRESGLELVARALLEPIDEHATLVVVERDRCRDLRLDDPRAAIDEVAERALDVGQQADAIALLEQQQHRADRVWLALRHGLDRREPLLHRHARIAQRPDRLRRDARGEAVERRPIRLDGLLSRREI